MFDANGNLAAGLHDWTLQEIKDRLVTNFPTSKTRSQITAGYEQLRTDMTALNIEAEHWLDGSYVTSKEDPNDIDMLTFVPEDQVNKLTPAQQIEFIKLVSGKATRQTHHCDSYFALTVPAGHQYAEFWRLKRKYWLGEFGYDRSDHAKGIVRTFLQLSVPAPTPTQ